MTKIKKTFGIVLSIALIFTLSGCNFKRDNMEDIEIYTTNYPTEYITKRLYGDHSNIHSIYPDGININTYKLTNKQIRDYSKADLYIFTGLNQKEKNYVSKFRDNNQNLKILDTTLSMEYTNSIEELWLDPSNFLMMAQNIKKGFNEYISNYYLNNDINKNYEELKIEASNLDAKIKQTVANAETKIIVASNDMFKYLEKYGLTVYSLENNSNLTTKTIEDVKNLINDNKVHYIFIKENEETNKTIKDLIEETDIQTIKWNTLTNINENQRSENEDYFTIMNENIESLKNELYN